MKNRITSLLLSTILVFSSILFCCNFTINAAAKSVDTKPSVKCNNGIFIGSKEDNTNVLSFKGIPYAKAPVGELRWKAPQPADASSKKFDATKFGKSCLQTPSNELIDINNIGEDCLTLNIWTADNDLKNKPVMLFIHGGSYGWGGSCEDVYNGKYLVNTYPDVILVTINYRLNLFGFIDFSHVPGGEDFKDAPYLGILDQQMALKWVKDNIASFGGDPNNVTIFGESAGSGSVISLLAAEGSEGLFNRAIAQSGVNLNNSQAKFDETNQAGLLLEATGCKNMNELMALSEKEIYDAMEKETSTISRENSSTVSDNNNFPLKDDNNSIIPYDINAAIVARSKNVDLMIGTTGEEFRMWVEEMGADSLDENMEIFYDYIQGRYNLYKKMYPQYVSNIDKALEISKPIPDSKYAAMYPGIWNYTDVVSELSFRIPSINLAEARCNSNGTGKTYMYQFNKRTTETDWFGAAHACELGYVFNSPYSAGSLYGKPDSGLAKDISHCWVNFARTGNPSTEKVPWPEYNTAHRPTMLVNDDCTMTVENDPNALSRKLLQKVDIYK